jgi:hypothetical protein
MISKNRLAIGIMFVFVVAFMSFLFFWIKLPSEEGYKYLITVPGTSTNYYTNSYIINNNCITFKYRSFQTVTICGNYIIK